MSTSTLLAIGGLIIIGAVVTIVVVMVTKKGPENKDLPKSGSSIRRTSPLVFQENLPKNFSIGPIITNGPYESANLCDRTKLFPMKDVYVEYDKEGEIPDGSRCLEYLASP